MLPLPEQIDLVTNILEEYNQATPLDLEEGRDWYYEASHKVEDLATKYKITHTQAALVVAALSPQLAWPLNIAYANDFLNLGHCGHFLSCQVKAMECLSGSRTALSTDGKNALKTHNFAQLLANPSADLIVIDSHAASICLGHKITKPDSDRLTKNTRGFYNLCESAYREAAAIANERSSALQAITWLSYRRRTGLEDIYGR